MTGAITIALLYVVLTELVMLAGINWRDRGRR